MRSTPKFLAACAATGTMAAVPAAASTDVLGAPFAQAQGPAPAGVDVPDDHASALAADATSAVRTRLVRHTVRRERKIAALQGRKLRRGYRAALRTLSTDELLERRREAQRDLRRARRAALERQRTGATVAAGGSGSMPGHLAAIAQCESGGNPAAVGGGGTYRGLFQFDQGTWQSVGGSGDPAAAPVAEQVKRAEILYSRAGASPWPVCGS
ncbi:MAG TPA: transglycosylase family protein [Baekduia sp.]|nr:transglycosylase family protein [Baekduia sp.]